MIAAIENMGQIKADKKVLILGDMFELGNEAAAEHAAIIKKALEAPVDKRIFIGNEFFAASHLPDFRTSGLSDFIFFQTAEEAISALKAKPIKNATILIKGSRGMALERLAELF
jgi:UDP-N-acetylmuramoyl-tripeptide--D-alanyl-D-alanine ligase